MLLEANSYFLTLNSLPSDYTSSSPFPTGLLHRAWVGLWNGCFAHDLPLSFLSGVQLGAPQPRKYIGKSHLSAHVFRRAASQPRLETRAVSANLIELSH